MPVNMEPVERWDTRARGVNPLGSITLTLDFRFEKLRSPRFRPILPTAPKGRESDMTAGGRALEMKRRARRRLSAGITAQPEKGIVRRVD